MNTYINWEEVSKFNKANKSLVSYLVSLLNRGLY